MSVRLRSFGAETGGERIHAGDGRCEGLEVELGGYRQVGWFGEKFGVGTWRCRGFLG